MRFQIGLLLLLCLVWSFSTQQVCASSATGCTSCYTVGGVDCYNCMPGYRVDNNIRTCYICPVGTYNSAGTATICTACPTAGQTTIGTGRAVLADCFTAIADCTTYSSQTVCSACTAGKLPINGGTACGTSIGNCASQASPTQCITCSPGFVLTMSASACVSPITNCEGHGPSMTCLVCSFGYKPSVDQRTCIAADSRATIFELAAGLLLAAVTLLA